MHDPVQTHAINNMVREASHITLIGSSQSQITPTRSLPRLWTGLDAHTVFQSLQSSVEHASKHLLHNINT